MKKYIHFIFITTLLFSAFTACDREKIDYGLDDGNPVMTGEGKVHFSFVLDIDVETRASVSKDDYIITIYDSNGVQVGETYKYGSLPETIELNVGSYTIEAKSHASVSMETPSDSPYYVGVKGFEIKKGETTVIDKLVCTMNNIKVELVVHESLSEILNTYEVTATFKANETVLTFSYDQDHTGDPFIFFPAINESNVLMVQLKGQPHAGSEIDLIKTYTGVIAGSYRRVNFAYTGNIPDGGTDINLAIDVTCEDVNKNITVPDINEGNGNGGDGGNGDGGDGDGGDGGDEGNGGGTDPNPNPEPNGGITILGNGFNIDNPIILEFESEEEIPVSVSISVPNRAKDLWVDIKSSILTPDVLGEIGLTNRFNLAAPGEYAGVLGPEGLGFPIESQVIGATSLPFDISAFIPLLAGLAPGTSQFVINVSDQKGNELTKTLTLTVVE